MALQRMNCPACGAGLKVDGIPPGKTVRCPKCKQPLVVPAADAITPQAPAAVAVPPTAAQPAPAPPRSKAGWLIGGALALVALLCGGVAVVAVAGVGIYLATSSGPPAPTTPLAGPPTTPHTEPETWVKVDIPEGPCSLLFPSQPRRREESLESGKWFRYTANKDDLTYALNVWQLPPEQRRRDGLRGTDAIFQDALEAFLEPPGAKLLNQRPIALGDYPGFECTVQQPAKVERTRVYISEHYFMVWVGAKDKVAEANRMAAVNSPDAERFLKSFTIGKPAAGGTGKVPPGGKKPGKP